MLWFCHYKAHDGVPKKVLRERYETEDEGLDFEQFKGVVAWYAFAGLSEGVVVMDVEDPVELTAILQPCRHLIEWDVKACKQMDMATERPSATYLR